jgi:hypothetical protein
MLTRRMLFAAAAALAAVIVLTLATGASPVAAPAAQGPDAAGPAERAAPRDPAAPEASFTGKLTLLRVHDVGTGYGSPTMDIEVVIRLDTVPDRAFGFQLRDDANKFVRQGMLDLLRDAFDNNWTVTINENSGIVFRVWLTKP